MRRLHHFATNWATICIVSAGWIFFAAGPLAAQAPPAGQPKAAPKAAPKASPRDKPAEPENIKLETKDGWSIQATYYAGKLKKQAVPFLLLHGWEGQRSDYDGLAKFLQAAGHSVLCPDLRGHGQSNIRPGSDKAIEDPADLKPVDMQAIVWDIEACKKFLREKNNAGELNIEMLTLVAADFACIPATAWSDFDWRAPALPSYKQGQDVKALVFLSPWQSFKGLSMQKALVNPVIKNQMNVMVFVGKEDGRGYPDAKKLNTSLENFRPKMKEKNLKNEDRTLFFIELPTNLAGTKLLHNDLNIRFGIENFIKMRLIDHQDALAWTERKSPLDN
jgi:hypothetical protein